MVARSLAVAMGCLALSGSTMACSTPCEALRERADDCESAAAPYVEDERSVCEATRRHLGSQVFDPFAECMLDQRCDSLDAVAYCQKEYIEEPDPCLRYRLWASACALEPTGTEDDCAAQRTTTDVAFEAWSDCITEGGCPEEGDDRYDRCQDLLTSPQVPTGGILNACMEITQWTEACRELTPETLPPEGASLAACLAQSSSFTADSWIDYAECLAAADCEDMVTRILCLDVLRVVDVSGAESFCARLMQYSQSCGINLGADSVENCAQVFARFTDESLEEYIACVEAVPCDQPAGTLQCAGALMAR